MSARGKAGATAAGAAFVRLQAVMAKLDGKGLLDCPYPAGTKEWIVWRYGVLGKPFHGEPVARRRDVAPIEEDLRRWAEASLSDASIARILGIARATVRARRARARRASDGEVVG